MSTPGEDRAAAQIVERTADVRRRIAAVAHPDRPVTLIGVTKTFPLDTVVAACAAGLADLGENYAQELVAKHDGAVELGLAPRWHFIGGLQRNKVKLLAGKVAMWHTVDRAPLISEIAKRSPGDTVLIQVNTTSEPQKSGCDPAEAEALVALARERALDVVGLMTIGPTAPGGGGGDPRPSFDVLRSLGERCEVEHLSMGMSADYELAVAHGATMVRVGSALFGPRSPSSG